MRAVSPTFRRMMLAACGLALAALAGSASLRALPARAAEPGAPATLKTTALGQGLTLVFVPDLGLGRMTWMPTVRKLLAGHRVVMVDLPGHGESPMLDPFSFPAAAAALDQVLAKEKGESTIVIGQGAGGIIAAYAAKAHPERVKGLVLIDVALKFPIKIEDQQRTMFLRWMDENFDPFIRQAYGQRGRDSTQSAEILAQVMLIPPATVKPYLRELLTMDAAASFKGFTRPVLYIGTARGWPAEKTWPVLASERGLEVFGAADTLRIPASATLVMKDQPDSLAAAIARFAAKALAVK